MKKPIFFLLLLILPIFLILCEKNEDSITNPQIDHVCNNLLLNSSFEINNSPSYKFWRANSPAYIDFSEDTPPEDGQWAISLPAEWGPPISLSQSIKTIRGNNIYVLSFYAKLEGIGGMGVLGLQNSDTIIVSKQIGVNDTSWVKYTISDTISSTQWDTIFVALNGGISQLVQGRTYFDLCVLESKIAN